MHLHLAPRPILATLFAVALVLGAAGCGDDDEPAATGDGGTTTTDGGSTGGYDYGSSTGGSPESEDGTIVAVDYSLSDTTAAPGAEIVLRNDGSESHTATSDEEGLFDLEADSGATSDPDTAPEEPGTYTFHCEIHDTMTATLTVEE